MANIGLFVYIVTIFEVSKIWSKPYNIYWNLPTYVCKINYKIDFTIVGKEYGILINENDEFRGDKISLLYNPGLFPMIYNYTMSTYVHETDYEKLYFVNGGIPQNGNISLHLDALEDQVKREVTNSKNSGLIVIDMEQWGATWQQNFLDMEIYRIESRLKIKRTKPNLSKTEIEARAKLQYERNADRFLSGTLQVAKSTRPYAKWGYYQYPQCFNQPGEDFCSQRTMSDNNQMIRMWKLSDAVFPSLYMNNISTVAARAALVRGAVREAHRVAKFASKALLNIPYITTKYHNEDRNILDADLETLIKVPKEEGADGVVIWGSYMDYNTFEKCSKLMEYVKNTLGPMAKKYISAT